MPPGAFVEVEHAADVGLEDVLEWAFHRDAAQVHDGFAAGHQGVHRRLVREVAGHDFLAGPGGRHGRPVGQPQRARERLQALAQHPAQRPGSAGQQQAIQLGVRHRSHQLSYNIVDYRNLNPPASIGFLQGYTLRSQSAEFEHVVR
jgi:hypothetical protein